MSIYLKNNPAKFHPGPILNDRALGFFEEGHPNKNNNNQTSSNRESVPDLTRKLSCLKDDRAIALCMGALKIFGCA